MKNAIAHIAAFGFLAVVVVGAVLFAQNDFAKDDGWTPIVALLIAVPVGYAIVRRRHPSA